MTTPTVKTSTRRAYLADRVFDGEAVWEGQAVIVDGEMVAAVVPAAEIPRDIPVVAAPGCTILPGLIDAHVHFMRWEGPLYLAYGVTTIRDVANPLEWILQQRSESASRPWPRIFTTGPALDGPEPHWPEISLGCTDAEDGRAKVRELAAAGVDGIKLYVKLPGEWIAGMVDEAHALGLPVMMHCGAVSVPMAADAGIDEFFHLDGLLDDIWPGHPGGWLEVWGHEDFPSNGDRLQQVADVIAAQGLIATPTLTVWDYFRLARFRYEPLPEDAPFVPRQLVDWFQPKEVDQAGGQQWMRAVEHAQQFLGLLIERQVPILAGTDVPWTFFAPGHLLWRELALLVESGMSPIDTLRAATADAAHVLRVDGLGRLAPGYTADLVVVEGDPTKAIPARPKVRTVLRAGQPYDPADLFAVAGEYTGTFDSEPLALAFNRYFTANPS